MITLKLYEGKELGEASLIHKTAHEWANYIRANDPTDEKLEQFAHAIVHHLSQQNKGFKDYILLQNFDWFGAKIPKGTLFIQVNADYWQPTIVGTRYPSMQVDFYTIKDNETYFLPFIFGYSEIDGFR